MPDDLAQDVAGRVARDKGTMRRDTAGEEPVTRLVTQLGANCGVRRRVQL